MTVCFALFIGWLSRIHTHCTDKAEKDWSRSYGGWIEVWWIKDLRGFSRWFQWLERHFWHRIRLHTSPQNETYMSPLAVFTGFCSCIASSTLPSSLHCLHALCGWILMKVRRLASPGFGSTMHAHQTRRCQWQDKVPAWVISHFAKPNGSHSNSTQLGPEYSQIKSLSVFKCARHYSAGHVAVI